MTEESGLTPFGEFARKARAEAFLVFPGMGNEEYRLQYFGQLLSEYREYYPNIIENWGES